MRILALLFSLAFAAPAFAQTADFTAPPLGSDGAKMRADLNAELGNIQTLLNSKLASAAVSAFGLTLIDDASATAARATLGLGTAALSATGDFATAAQGTLAGTALQPAAIGATVQAFDAELAAIAGLVSAADRLPYFTGSGTAALVPFTSAARALLAATMADDQVWVASGTGAGAYVTLPDSDAAGVILGYDQATNAWSTKTDDDVPEAGDFTNFAATAPLTFSAGTVSTSIATGRLVCRTTAGTGVMEVCTPDATLALTGLSIGVVDVICTGCIGAVEIAGLDTADVTTGTFADARVDGSLEADEVNPTLGTQTQGNFVLGVTGGLGIGVTGTPGEGWSPTLALNATGATDEWCLTYEATGPTTEWQTCGGGGGLAATDIDTSAELRGILTDETGTGPAMFGLTSTMADDLGCTGSQVVRRNAGDTAYECATLAGGGDALVANPLSQFAATTSAQLRGVLSDEVGTGAAVFGMVSTMADDLGCTGSQVVRRNAGDTAYECATLASITTIAVAPATDQANWAPSGFTTGTIVIKAQPTTNSFIGGIASPTADQQVTLINDSAFVIMIVEEDGSSTAANRFALGTGSVIILPGENVVYRYSSTSSRWVRQSYSLDLFDVGPSMQLMVPGASTAISNLGLHSITTLATLSTINPTATPTDDFTEYAAMQFTNATASGASNVRGTLAWVMRGATAGRQGLIHTGRVRFPALGATGGVFSGLANNTGSITTQGSVQVNCLFLGANGGQTTLRIFMGDASAGTPIDLGANFPVPSATASYEYLFYAAPAGSSVQYMVRRMDSRQVTQGSLTTNIPATTTGLTPYLGIMVGATATSSTAQMNYLLTRGL